LGNVKRQEIFNIFQREVPGERKQVIKAAQTNRDKSTFVINSQQQQRQKKRGKKRNM